MTKFRIMAVAAMALMAPMSAHAAVTVNTATYNTSSSTCYTAAGATYSCNNNLNGTAGNSLIVKGSEDATLQVKVTAWQANQSTNAITSAYLGTYSGGGLGVTGAGDTSGGTAGAGGTHQIDNVGGYTDFVMLQFSRAVRLDQIGTKLYDVTGVTPRDSDVSWFNADGVLAPTTWNANINLAAYGNAASLWTTVDGGATDGTRSMGVASNMFASIWLISAAQLPTTDFDDGFKLSQIIVTPKVAVTPEPGTWAMMIFGFGAIGATLRRRARGTAGASVAA